MLDETRTIESEAELIRPQRASPGNRRTRAKPRQYKPAPAKAEISSTREIILRLIELIKQV